jgi:polysaccharide biosynthesis/export protein
MMHVDERPLENAMAPDNSVLSLIKLACAGLALAVLLAVPVPGLAQGLPGYLLNPGDELEIDVWREEDLQRTVMVRPDGKFSFPLTGEVEAAGRTPAEVQAEVTRKLRDYIPEAVVTVTVTGISGNQVYVIGQVNNPGTFIMNPQLNVLQALSSAGGMTAFASANNIIILRTSGERQETLSFRYDDIARGRNLEQNIPLEAGDVIIVP